MAADYQLVEWLSRNAARAYPLAVDATGLDRTGTLRLPVDFLVELYLAVPAALGADPTRFLLKAVTAHPAGYALTVGYDAGGGSAEDVASALVPASHRRYDAYTLAGLGRFARAAGRVTVGGLDGLASGPGGRFVFDLDGGRLDPDAVRLQVAGLDALYVSNAGAGPVARLQGDVELVAGANVQWSVQLVDGRPMARVDVIPDDAGSGLLAGCSCGGEHESAPPIRTINGVPAGPDLTLEGDDCLQVEAIEGGFRLRDACSRPCCGCAQLDLVVEQQRAVRDGLTTLEAFLARLEAAQSQMTLSVLGSRLNDTGCVACS